VFQLRFGTRGLRLAVAGALLVFAGHGAAESPDLDGRWVELRSANFTLFSDSSARTCRRLATRLEELRWVLERLTSLRLQAPAPTLIYVFRGESSFADYKPLYRGRPAAVAGAFIAHDHARYIAMNASAINAAAVIQHEYAHDFMATNMPGLPLWLEEGLAELYSTFEVRRTGVRIGSSPGHHLRWLRNHQLMPFEELFSVRRDSPLYNERDRKGAFYAQAWALTHMLLLGTEERRTQLDEYVERCTTGSTHDEAFAAAFGTAQGELQKELADYVRRPVLPSMEAPINVDLDHQMAERQMLPQEALFRLGDLLAHQVEPRPEAAAHFHAALAIDPRHGPSMAALGRLAELDGRSEEAFELYSQAAAASPDDALVQYLYGAHLLARSDSPERALDALLRATTLAPDLGPAWADLTDAYLALGHRGEEVLAAAQTAHRLMPRRVDVSINLIRLLLSESLVDEAREVVAIPLAARPEARRRGWSLLVHFRVDNAQRLLLADDEEAALIALDAAEAELDATADPDRLRSRIAELRQAVTAQRRAHEFSAIRDLVDQGREKDARTAIDSLLADEDDDPAANGALRILHRLDHPNEPADPSAVMFRMPSPPEVDELNSLIARNDLEGALSLLERLILKAASPERTWLDVKAQEIRLVIAHNRFVDHYNRAVVLYNAGRLTDAEVELASAREAATLAADMEQADELLDQIRSRRVETKPAGSGRSR